MKEWGLVEKGWTFKFDRAKRRIGCCDFAKKVISVSEYFATLNDKAEIEDTILHEIAHALAGPGANHGPKWKAMAIKVGADPTRCSDTAKGLIRITSSGARGARLSLTASEFPAKG